MKGARRRYNSGSAPNATAPARRPAARAFSVLVGVASCVLIGYLVNAWAYFVLDAGAGLVREHAFWMGPLTWAQLGILPLGASAFVAGGALLGGMATRPHWLRAAWLVGLVGLSWILVLTWSLTLGRGSHGYVSPMTKAAARLNDGAVLIQIFATLTVYGSWLVALSFRPAKRLQYVTGFAGWDLRGNWNKYWDKVWNRVPRPGWGGPLCVRLR